MTDSRYCWRCHLDCSNDRPCACCDRNRMLEHHHLPTDVRRAYDQRFPGAVKAAATDPLANYARTLAEHWLSITDAVMEDEGVEGRIRQRVLNAILYGTATPAEVEERHRLMDAQVEMMKTVAAPKFAMPPDWER
jgi:hypothetical protein